MFLISIYLFKKNVSTRKKKNQQRRQLIQLNGTLNDFVVENSNTISALGNDTLEPENNGSFNNAERIINGGNSAFQNQVLENDIDDKIRKAVDNAVLTVGNHMHDAILTAMENVVIQRVEMAVRSITGSSVQRPSRVRVRKDFLENTENTPLMSASSRLDINIDQDK